jgi:hypothetical protein
MIGVAAARGSHGHSWRNLILGRVGPAGCPADPPSEPHEPLVAAYGSSKPLGRVGSSCAGSCIAGAVPAPAGGVYQAGVVVVRL